MEIGKSASPTVLPPRSTLQCRNCGAPAPGAYCPRCGQSTSEHLPTAFEFAHEFVLHYLAADGRLWRTLWALVSRPGFLTTEYLQGRKFAYVLPLRLYLTTSVVFFLALKLTFLLHTAGTLEPMLERTLPSDDFYMGFGIGHAVRHADGTVTCTLPRVLCEPVKAALLGSAEAVAHRIAGFPIAVLSSLSSAMFVLLPLFALWLKLAFHKRNYGEHFLFALHLHSFWFLILLLILLPVPQLVDTLVVLYVAIFSFIALQRVYGGRRWQTILKGLMITVVYGISLTTASLALMLRAFIT
jgi:Protein of unknown function (DUF3667)